MADAVLYGPHGQILKTIRAGADPTTLRQAVEKVGGIPADMLDKVDWKAAEQEVSKRVRSQATSLTQVWDPRRGKPKPTSITYDTLRMMSNRNEWCSAIIKTRINQIGKVPWSIKPKDDDDSSPVTKRLCEEVTRLLERPSLKGSRPNSRSWRQFIGEVLRDILVLDAGCIEKERNGRKWIVAMYPVDGATIAPNIDDKGGYGDDAYVQVVDGAVTARFGMEDLVYIMDNPQTDVKYSGYGFSPLEWLIVSVTADLYSSKYNASYFEKGSVPEGIINLGEDVSPDDVDAFRLYWMNEIMGKPWSLPIIGGKGVEWIPWRASNKDMEYMEYQRWLMQRMCAVYQIAPQEVGMLEDVNRSTADEQQESNQSKSIEPVLSLIEDYFEVEIIGEHGLGVGDLIQFAFDEEQESEDAIDARYAMRVEKGAASRNEWRTAVNMDPSDEPGADMLLVAGQLQGLPTEEDVQALGAANQQQMQQEQQEAELKQQQEQGFGSGKVPWKPADPSDPDVQAAQGQHELSSGLGPKQLPVDKAALSTDVDVAKGVAWDKAPGGKRYEFAHRGHSWTVTRRNNAAGGPKWEAVHSHPLGTQRVVGKGDNFAQVRGQAEAHIATIAKPTLGKATDWLPTHYHVAPSAVRASIRRHGLDYRLGNPDSDHDHDPDYTPGNYLFTDLAEAKGLAHAKRDAAGEPHDVWLVNAIEHHCLPDPHDDEFRSAVYTERPIEPRHLSLGDVLKSTTADRNPALTRVHDDLDSEFVDAADQLLGDLQRLFKLPLEEARALHEIAQLP